MIEIKENTLDLDTYLDIRASVNWKVLKREQAEKAPKQENTDSNDDLIRMKTCGNGQDCGGWCSHLLYTGFCCQTGMPGRWHRKEDDGKTDSVCGEPENRKQRDDALSYVCQGQGEIL